MLAEQRFLKRRSEDATPNKEAESLQSIAQGKALWNHDTIFLRAESLQSIAQGKALWNY